MTVADMIAELSQHGFGDVDTSQQLRAINNTLWYITGLERWPFREKTMTLNFDGVSATPTNWPTDFSKVIWIADTTTGNAVMPERLETIRSKYTGNLTTVSDPAGFYYFVNRTPYFYPIPTASTGRYTLDYIARQTALDVDDTEASILLPAEYHQYVVFGALVRLYLMDDDTEEAPLFKQEFIEGLQIMREELLRRQYQQPDQIFVTDEYDDWTTPFLLP